MVVFTAAGISVSAGLLEFRSAQGISQEAVSTNKFVQSKRDLFNANVEYQDDATTTMFHDHTREIAEKSTQARPTVFHRLLTALAAEKRLLRLYTQNIDTIETQLPELVTYTPLEMQALWPRTIQLHGSSSNMSCVRCWQTFPMEPRMFQGATPPDCRACAREDHD
jgi:NAD-dependent histone deacetylase SIR2